MPPPTAVRPPRPWWPVRLTGVIGAAGLLVLVVLIGELTVNQHRAYAFDQRWSQRIFDYARYRPHVRSLTELVGHATEPWVWRGVVVAAAFLLWRRGRRSAAVWWVVTMALAGLAGISLKVAVARARPDWPGSYFAIDGYTFPSGHAVNVAAFVASTLVVLWPVIGFRLRVLATTAGGLLVLGVGADRVLLGVHHVSDVLAGWALGLAVVLATGALGVDDAVWAGRAGSAQSLRTGLGWTATVAVGVVSAGAIAAIAPRGSAPEQPWQARTPLAPSTTAPAPQTARSNDHEGMLKPSGPSDIPIPMPGPGGALQLQSAWGEATLLRTEDLAPGSVLVPAVLTHDLDGDGWADVVVTTTDARNRHRTVHVLFGTPAGITRVGALMLTGLAQRGPDSLDDRFGAALGASTLAPGSDGSVAEEGSRQATVLLVGSPGESFDGRTEAGAVYLFRIGHDRRAALLQRITETSLGLPGGSGSADHFGAVIDGPVVGTPDRDVVGPDGQVAVDAGAVVALTLDDRTGAVAGAREWTQDSPGVPDSAEAGDQFGAAVDRNGFVGVPGEDLTVGGRRVSNAGLLQRFGPDWTPASAYDRSGVGGGVAEPGDRLGAAVVTRASPDDRVDVGIPGADRPGAPDAGEVAGFAFRTQDAAGNATGFQVLNHSRLWAGHGLPGQPRPGVHLGAALGRVDGRQFEEGSLDILLVGVPEADGGAGEVIRSGDGGGLPEASAVWRYTGAASRRFGSVLPRSVPLVGAGRTDMTGRWVH